MKQLLTLLLLLCSLTISSQSKIITGPKNKQQQAAAKPKQQTAAKPKQQPQQAAKPQQQQAAPKQQAASKQKPAAKPKQPSISSPSGYENGYGYVDLGLSVKWATTNVGASSPTDNGSDFAWGETRTKSDYDWSTYFDTNDEGETFFKYATNKKTTLDLSDDAAHVNWGGSWRMPTRAEQDELREKCTWTWTIQNGVKGYKVVSKRNSNSIFLPAVGSRYGSYWSLSLRTNDSVCACYLYFDSSSVDSFGCNRYYGHPVRAVCP